MILNSSQDIQTSHSLDSISSRRVNSISRSSTANSDDKKAEAEQKRQDESTLRQLRARDREVRAHEAAHVAAGGSLVRGGPSFTLQRGPDGRSYAVGGEVQLDTSTVANDPEATLRKSEQVRAAALAPAQPSPQDLRVAANANQMAARARIDIAVQRREEAQAQNEARLEETSGAENSDAQSATASTENEPPVTSTDNSAAVNPGASQDIRLESASVTPQINRLQSSEPTAAAISNFMATAQSEPAPVRFNQFV